jgi:hypothetical protein
MQPMLRADLSGLAEAEWPTIGLLRKLRWLGSAGVALLVSCMLLLPFVDIALRWRGYTWTRTHIDRLLAAGHSMPSANHAALASRVALIVGIAARKLPWPATCLRQALLCRALLARYGIESELRVGVEMSPSEGFAAHAWVEHEGRVIIGGERARERYQVMM